MMESRGASNWIFRDSRTLPLLKATRLHHIVAQQSTWTDDTWAQALGYLKTKLSVAQTMTLSGFTADSGVLTTDDARTLRNTLFKEDQLNVFRNYPPSVLVAFFDLARAHRLLP